MYFQLQALFRLILRATGRNHPYLHADFMASTAKLRRLAKTVSRQPEWILALAATVAVVWLHFFFLLHVGGLWRDEVNLINLSSRHSLAEMSKDSFPVLMPLLVSGWTAIGLGQTDMSLRLLGALIGLTLPAALWLAAWKIRRAPPLIGLVLLVFNSTVIMFGDSLRAFGLGSVLILLTTAAAGWFLKNPTWRRAGILAALAVLSVQALYQNAVFIAAICFGAWAVCARQKKRCAAVKILVVAAVSAASLLPYWARIVSLPDPRGHCGLDSTPCWRSSTWTTPWDSHWNNTSGSGDFWRSRWLLARRFTAIRRRPATGRQKICRWPTERRWRWRWQRHLDSSGSPRLPESGGCFFPLLALMIFGFDTGWLRNWRLRRTSDGVLHRRPASSPETRTCRSSRGDAAGGRSWVRRISLVRGAGHGAVVFSSADGFGGRLF